MPSGLISLSDIGYWVSTKFEATRNAPVLTTRIDASHRMMQLSRANLNSWDKVTPHVYVVEGRDTETFMPLSYFDILFLDGPVQSLEKLLHLTEVLSNSRQTVNRVNSEGTLDAVRDRVVERIWDHLMVKAPQPV